MSAAEAHGRQQHRQRLFSDSAELYDAIYGSFKDYAAEAAVIANVIRTGQPSARTLLDVGCGTGEHVMHLRARGFVADGLDIDPALLAIAARKVPAAEFFEADMTDFDLGTRYDVVACLFSSIGYLLEEPEVTQAFTCFAAHLARGGVILVEPWFTPDAWHTGQPRMTPPVDLPELKICRMNVSDRRGDISLLHFHYLIGTPAGVDHVEEKHELALYPVEQLLKCFRLAGLVASHDPIGLSGRGLYIARRPGES